MVPICDGSQLSDRGKGHRFSIGNGDNPVPAFVIRFDNQVHGYLNRCAHQEVELDWNEGEFFDIDRRYLLCATHGALYDPASGRCIFGRCNGRALTKLDVREVDGKVYLRINKTADEL